MENLRLVHTVEHFTGQLDIPLIASFTAEGIDTQADLNKTPGTLENAYAFSEMIMDEIR